MLKQIFLTKICMLMNSLINFLSILTGQFFFNSKEYNLKRYQFYNLKAKVNFVFLNQRQISQIYFYNLQLDNTREFFFFTLQQLIIFKFIQKLQLFLGGSSKKIVYYQQTIN
ncbi:transmembrane protein, putative (macronuclear) [Tetrahymena thermophila SB210]|uniref:Transmembrane protein, putative n=1 Tax=Tetrahymena thermophila (strain SB210) TaxID=312017 RepID=W7XKG1_TETTS|nr:transmembrane protein, putative [Tetrahymena thermophila SB210]EWS74874.1 transmembrane protein, putative [Tetrahymena thermophila SB210]|eukprot:XP_012652587.1 transmembrane protein, putative [Tetrahymena thermophila SB210]